MGHTVVQAKSSEVDQMATRGRASSPICYWWYKHQQLRSTRSSLLTRQHLLHFVHELAQVERLEHHLGLPRRGAVGVERYRREPGDEHDLASSMPSIFGITTLVSNS